MPMNSDFGPFNGGYSGDIGVWYIGIYAVHPQAGDDPL